MSRWWKEQITSVFSPTISFTTLDRGQFKLDQAEQQKVIRWTKEWRLEEACIEKWRFRKPLMMRTEHKDRVQCLCRSESQSEWSAAWLFCLNIVYTNSLKILAIYILPNIYKNNIGNSSPLVTSNKFHYYSIITLSTNFTHEGECVRALTHWESDEWVTDWLSDIINIIINFFVN